MRRGPRRMIGRAVVKLVTALVLSLLVSMHALAWDTDDLRRDWPGFLLGLGAGIVAHELGHVAFAKGYGYDVDHDGLSIVYPDADFSDSEQLRIASAGFQTQWLITESVFARYEKNGVVSELPNFAAGLVVSQIAVAAAYLTVLKDHDQGDIEGMSQATGVSRTALALSLAVPSALDAWRLSGRNVPRWLPAVSRASKGVLLGAIWTF